MHRLRTLLTLALGIAGVALVTACQEDLEGGAACPALCPEQELQVRDTVITPVTLDTTLVGYPVLGSEPAILVAARGDTLRTAMVARFDTVAQYLTTVSDTSLARIVQVDSARLVFDIADTPVLNGAAIFDVYDVDTVAAEPDTAAVRTLVRPDRFLASLRVGEDSVAGTIIIPLPQSVVQAHVLSGQRMRLAVTLRGDVSNAVRIVSSNSATGPLLVYRGTAVNADTQTVNVPTYTLPPSNAPELTGLRDFQLVLAQPATPAGVLAVGGIPGRRVYLRFEIPQTLLDSAEIVRATLVLNQIGNASFPLSDSVTVFSRVVLATPVLDDDPGKAAFLLGAIAIGPDSLRVAVAASGTRRVEMAPLLRSWQAVGTSGPTRALVLQASDEGSSAGAVLFYPIEAGNATLRPRLELSFIPRASFGLP